MRVVVFGVLALFAASCETLEFYRQAVAGQLSIVQAEQPVEKLIASPDTDATLREHLVAITSQIAVCQGPVGARTGQALLELRSYRSGLGRLERVCNAGIFDQATRWCYPVVGCASYRGYFDRTDANRYAQRLIVEQHDTLVGGVAAYSTLGWFNDPILSTFVAWPDTELAGLIFHELAHAKVFVGGDTSFNEAFASFVERRGVVEWLRVTHDEAQIERVVQRWQKSDRFVAYLLRWRDELQTSL